MENCVKCGVCEEAGMHEACGVFGVWAPEREVARMTFFGLQALQHRGQESAGIAVTDGREIRCEKGLGLAREVFDDETIGRMRGQAAIGHVRYATSGKDPTARLRLAHPLVAGDGEHCFALAHNGTLTNSADLIEALIETIGESELMRGSQGGASDAGTAEGRVVLDVAAMQGGGAVSMVDALPQRSDSQIAADLLARLLAVSGSSDAAIEALMGRMLGAYSMVVLTTNALYALRDFSGIRPLCLGKLPDEAGWVMASETCALDLVGADYVRDVEPGEFLRIDAGGVHAVRLPDTAAPAPLRRAQCLFEFVYFARPDSVIDGANVYRAREAMGRCLSREAPVEADIVIGVPDSGIPAAIGYARESGIVYSEGLIKNRYVDRTFIQPTQQLREQGIRIKLSPLHYAVRNRRVIVVDDSIVRGSTARQLVQLLRDAGAAEVHLRITSPAILWPCFLGINTDTQEQLIAATCSAEETCDAIGADSLAYLSLDGLKSCIYAEHPDYCAACFDGCYPTPCPAPLHDNAFLSGVEPQWSS